MPIEYVIKGNAAILKCSIPSFVADFVSVISWVDDTGNEILTTDDYSSSKKLKLCGWPFHDQSILSII